MSPIITEGMSCSLAIMGAEETGGDSVSRLASVGIDAAEAGGRHRIKVSLSVSWRQLRCIWYSWSRVRRSEAVASRIACVRSCQWKDRHDVGCWNGGGACGEGCLTEVRRVMRNSWYDA